MPKTSLPNLPVSALFGVVKPSGPTSMSVVNNIKRLVSKSRLFVESSKLEHHQKDKKIRTVKLGQGGTLDPLADGVLGGSGPSDSNFAFVIPPSVVGVGKATKKLSEFLDCVKEYRTTCLLGCETDSYDSEGARVRTAPWRHVTREFVESRLDEFRGKIQQTPPIFSALKMDGRPLYEYARNGIPLPRPIEKREVTVHSLELIEWNGSNHGYRWPEKTFSEQEKAAMETALKSVTENPTEQDDEVEDVRPGDDPPTAFVLSMKVSGGTYVRSIVHDLCHAVGSAGHVATLTRSKQGRFALEPADEERGCVPWTIFEEALVSVGEVDSDGWTLWEREVLDHLEVVE